VEGRRERKLITVDGGRRDRVFVRKGSFKRGRSKGPLRRIAGSSRFRELPLPLGFSYVGLGPRQLCRFWCYFFKFSVFEAGFWCLLVFGTFELVSRWVGPSLFLVPCFRFSVFEADFWCLFIWFSGLAFGAACFQLIGTRLASGRQVARELTPAVIEQVLKYL